MGITASFVNLMKNVRYLKSFLGEEAITGFFEARRKQKSGKALNQIDEFYYKLISTYLDQMKSYGTDHWWASDNKFYAAHKQLRDSRILINYDEFCNVLGLMIRRNVKNPFGHNYFLYMKESDIALNRLRELQII